MRSWRVREPRQRMALRLVALGYPLVVVPGARPRSSRCAAEEAVPRRPGAARRRAAGGRSASSAWGCSSGGSACFARARRAALPDGPRCRSSGRRRRPRPRPRRPRPGDAPPRSPSVPALARALGVAAPPVVFLDRDQPVLFCTGVRRHAVVVSRGAVRLLDPRGAARPRSRTSSRTSRGTIPRASWARDGGARAHVLQPRLPGALPRASPATRSGSPTSARRRRAATGSRSRAGSSSSTAPPPGRSPVRRTLPFAAALAEPLARVRSLDVEVRCRRLLDGAARAAARTAARALALAGASLTALLFFVV